MEKDFIFTSLPRLLRNSISSAMNEAIVTDLTRWGGVRPLLKKKKKKKKKTGLVKQVFAHCLMFTHLQFSRTRNTSERTDGRIDVGRAPLITIKTCFVAW